MNQFVFFLLSCLYYQDVHTMIDRPICILFGKTKEVSLSSLAGKIIFKLLHLDILHHNIWQAQVIIFLLIKAL